MPQSPHRHREARSSGATGNALVGRVELLGHTDPKVTIEHRNEHVNALSVAPLDSEFAREDDGTA